MLEKSKEVLRTSGFAQMSRTRWFWTPSRYRKTHRFPCWPPCAYAAFLWEKMQKSDPGVSRANRALGSVRCPGAGFDLPHSMCTKRSLFWRNAIIICLLAKTKSITAQLIRSAMPELWFARQIQLVRFFFNANCIINLRFPSNDDEKVYRQIQSVIWFLISVAFV